MENFRRQQRHAQGCLQQCKHQPSERYALRSDPLPCMQPIFAFGAGCFDGSADSCIFAAWLLNTGGTMKQTETSHHTMHFSDWVDRESEGRLVSGKSCGHVFASTCVVHSIVTTIRVESHLLLSSGCRNIWTSSTRST